MIIITAIPLALPQLYLLPSRKPKSRCSPIALRPGQDPAWSEPRRHVANIAKGSERIFDEQERRERESIWGKIRKTQARRRRERARGAGP